MSISLFDLTGKVAIVTGSGRGIGKALALGLARAGADVVVAARTAADIESTAAELRALGRKALVIPTDVRLGDQVTHLVQRTVDEWGKIDILVNNAGGTFFAKTLEMSEGAWDAIIRENLKSVFLCAKEGGKVMMRQKKGCIINMASVAGLFSYSTSAPYGAGKAAVISLTKTLAVDLGASGVRVNAIAPGFIETAGLLQVYKDHPEQREKRLAQVPLKRLGKPEDIVGVTIFLSSDASAYVTGQVFVVDGGLTCVLD